MPQPPPLQSRDRSQLTQSKLGNSSLWNIKQTSERGKHAGNAQKEHQKRVNSCLGLFTFPPPFEAIRHPDACDRDTSCKAASSARCSELALNEKRHNHSARGRKRRSEAFIFNEPVVTHVSASCAATHGSAGRQLTRKTQDSGFSFAQNGNDCSTQ